MITYAGNIQEGYRDTALVVTVDGLKIHVAAGSFFALGEFHTLLHDEEFTVTVRPEMQFLNASMVKVRADGSVRLLVDEVVGNDQAFDFTPDGPYQQIRPLFNCVVGPGETSLDGVRITVQRCLVAVETPPAPEPPSEGDAPPPLDPV